MAKRKRKLTAAEKAAKRKRREEFETIFIHGKMKRVRRPPKIEGMDVEDFIRANADAIWLWQEKRYEDLDEFWRAEYPTPRRSGETIKTLEGRELVWFLHSENGHDLTVSYALKLADAGPGEVVSLILQRSPECECDLPPENRGVLVSHDLHEREELEFLRRIVFDGPQIDIATTIRTYRLDTFGVDAEAIQQSWAVICRMHRKGRFELEFM